MRYSVPETGRGFEGGLRNRRAGIRFARPAGDIIGRRRFWPKGFAPPAARESDRLDQRSDEPSEHTDAPLARPTPRPAPRSRAIMLKPLPPGTHRIPLPHGGRPRSYLLHIPPGAGPFPLVMMLHGAGGSAEVAAAGRQFDAGIE